MLSRDAKPLQAQVGFKHAFPPEGFFPLPPAESHLCRDAYLKALLAPFESVSEDASEEPEEDWVPKKDFFATKKFEIEFMMISRRRTTMWKPTKYRPSAINVNLRSSAYDLSALVKARYVRLLDGFGISCITYLLEKIIKKIEIMRTIPPEGTDPKKTIFGWSCHEYFERFKKHSDTIYLDTFLFDQTAAQLQDLKYYVDLEEIVRLMRSLKNDLIENNDLCQGFGALLRDIQVDIMEVLAKPYEDMYTEHDNLATQLFKARQGKCHDPKMISKHRILKREQQYLMDYKAPIETRYQIDCIRNKLEQKDFEDASKVKIIQDELDKLKELTDTDTKVWNGASRKYTSLIEEYTNRINLTQECYDEDMETAENNVQMTLNKLNKCKDDLTSYQEKVQMFHLKIAETRAKIAKEEAAELEKLRILEEKQARKSELKEKAKATGKNGKKEKKKK
ncbi:uncharacterized protein LOC117582647 [Drosophila guanche]|uniref:Uncharacterized protein n=1 Tax=Drosophila guanche TaxID=7266 RepID=A0A3B0JB80_DROGU|nr:uncharacterized protein LOC117582647 [Drosophila guanche]SPP79604.1 Hypothetical predicted protein [Drosophila guanche]